MKKRYATFILELTDDTPLETLANGMEQSPKVAKALGMAEFTTPAAVSGREWKALIQMVAQRIEAPLVIEDDPEGGPPE
jgi:hypothetical protein